MYKLLIVDDEPNIRAGLKNLVEWDVYGIEIAGEAEDGMKAYLQIKHHQPDIALIDISMPNMTGLELIELCNNLDNPPKFIILSGYNDFEYVRTAIRYGAVNYLLKPVNQEELTNTIVSTVKLLDNSRAQKTYFKEGIQILRNDTLLRLLTHRIDSKELREKSRFLHLTFRCSSMRVGLLKPNKSQEINSKPILSAADIESCQTLCNSVCSCYAALDADTMLILILLDYSHSLDENDFLNLLQTCVQQLSDAHPSLFYTAVGPNVASANELYLSYNQALQEIERKQTCEQVLQKESSQLTGNTDVQEILFDTRVIIQALKNNTEEKINEIVQTYFHSISNCPQADLESIKYALIEAIIEIMQKLDFSPLTDQSIHSLKQRAFSIIRSSNTTAALEENLIVFFHVLSEQLNENTNSKYSTLVQNTLNYVREHYHDCNLSLKTLAAKMDVNPTYLGRQFSLETKEYFSDYINRIRIAQAIQLLNSTSWKTSKIAESVGFTTVSYFFTIFKKVTGGRPGDYRKNL